MTAPIYLDNNATAPARPEGVAAMVEAIGVLGNPASVHGFGRQARHVVETARGQLARALKTSPREIVFTSGATEANNLALNAPGRRILVSAVEHESVRAVPGVVVVPVDREGIIDLAALEAELARDSSPTIVAVMLANHETGIIQPIGEVVRLARATGALVHCDAVQAVGRIPVDFAALGVDTMALSAHKLGGPQGVGALVFREGTVLSAMMIGGGQERGLRAGTPAVPAIAGFGAVAAMVGHDDAMNRDHRAWRDATETRLAEACPDVHILGRTAPRLPNTSAIAMPGVAASTQIMAFDLAGIALSAGSACSSGRISASPVALAMGLGRDVAASAIRLSLGWRNTANDLSCFVEAWLGLWRRLGRSAWSPAA